MFLGDLIRRTLGESGGITPRRASRFEPDNDIPEPATVEAAAEAPGPAREMTMPAAAPAPLQTSVPPRHSDETDVPERALSSLEFPEVPERPAAAAAEPSAGMSLPRPTPAPAPPVERQAPRRDEPAPPAPLPPRLRPAQPPAAEHHTETIVREISETRIESRTIERRLESLVHVLERTEENRTTVPTPSDGKPTASPPPAPLARNVIVPAAARSVPAKPVAVEPPVTAPAAPVVHVTIGRVEVRAAAPAPAPREQRPREPRLNLEDYLRRREKA